MRLMDADKFFMDLTNECYDVHNIDTRCSLYSEHGYSEELIERVIERQAFVERDLNMYNKKYVIEQIEEFNRPNPLYLNIKGCVCYPVYLNPGERGWFLYEEYDWPFMPHRVHTSTVKDVDYSQENKIVVTTQNTRFTFSLI